VTAVSGTMASCTTQETQILALLFALLGVEKKRGFGIIPRLIFMPANVPENLSSPQCGTGGASDRCLWLFLPKDSDEKRR